MADWLKLYSKGVADLKDLDSFTEEGIRQALFSLAKDKAPGPYGFPISFYQCFWDIIKEDVLNLFKSLKSDISDLSRLNYSYIILIPKKSNQPTIKDYRPIYLEHRIIKIISNILSTRL